MHNQHAGLSHALATQHITHPTPVDLGSRVQAHLADQATPSQPTIDLNELEEQ
jgi:hypothetical protein